MSSDQLESLNDEELGHIFKSALQVVLEGEDAQLVTEAVNEVREPAGQSLTAIVLGLAAIGGGTAVLCILAARIAQVGGSEGLLRFYKGLPKETGNTIKAGASLVAPLGDVIASAKE